MTAPPRFASWLLDATRLPDAEAIAGDLWEEFEEHIVPARGVLFAECWYCWQIARSLAPLFFRSWERASVTRASTALVAAAVAATIPAAALLTLRAFVLSQVPLKTTSELSAAFVVTLLLVGAVTGLMGLAVAIRILHPREKEK